MRGEGAYDDDPYAEDWDGHDGPDNPAPPYWFPGQHLPDDARSMGLTHHVPDGALLDFAGSLDPSKRRHLVTAWVMLAVFGLPVVLAVLRLFYVL